MTRPSRSASLARLARWGALTTTLLMAAALLATVWSTHAGVRDASQILERGQGELLERELRLYLHERGEPMSSEVLAGALAELEASGLRYVAVVRRGGDIAAEAGSPDGETEFEPHRMRRRGRDEGDGGAGEVRHGPQRAGDRIRTAYRIREPRGARQQGEQSGRRGRRGYLAVAEYEPIAARDLRSRSARNLAIGGAASGAFLLVALGLGRWLLRRERMERAREREKRLASLGEMSAVLAHEIRNPLASLKGNVQLLAEMLPEGDRPRLKAERVATEAVRLENLAGDLLEFVRTGAIHPEPCDPAAFVRECAGAIDPAIEVSTERAPGSIDFDPARLRQAVTNLLENAVAAGGPVRLAARGERGGLTIAIEDGGGGIPEGDLDKIFEPFYTSKARGTGLGLAVARRIAQLHGGDIVAQSAPSGGAEFRIWIPGKSARPSH